MKNYTLRLKNTSEAELQRFDQFMLQILRENYERKKTEAKLNQFANEFYGIKNAHKDNSFNGITKKKKAINKSILVRVLAWIRLNIGKTNVVLHKKSIKGLENVLDVVQTLNKHTIFCQVYRNEAIINLKKITFDTFVAGEHLLFVMSIHDVNNKIIFRFQSETYYGMLELVKIIGYSVTAFNLRMIEITRILFLNAHNHKDKVDVIYEKIPAFIIAKIRGAESLKKDIDKLLRDYFSTWGTNENKGILNILQTLKIQNSEELYNWLYKNPNLVMRIYEAFSGNDKRNFVAFIMNLIQIKKTVPDKSQQIYLSNDFWSSNIQLNINWRNSKLEITNSSTPLNNFGNLVSYSYVNTRAINSQPDYKILYKGTPLNPLDLITVKTVIETNDENKETKKSGRKREELKSDQSVLFVKYSVDALKEKAFWDVIYVASTLAGGYGAVRVIITKGAGWLLKSMAVAELTKLSMDLVMLSDRAKVALIKAGLESLVQNWTIISITTDFAFLSFDGLYALAKYGKRGAKVLRAVDEAEQAAHLEKQAE
ncbi:hypothetical protein BWK58_07070, partial [Flavobacterium columnare]